MSDSAGFTEIDAASSSSNPSAVVGSIQIATDASPVTNDRISSALVAMW